MPRPVSTCFCHCMSESYLQSPSLSSPSSPLLFLQSHPVPGPLPASPGAFLWRQLPWAGGPAWLGRSWQSSPPLPRDLGRLLRGTGAPGSSEAPRLPRAAPLAGGAMSPLAQGEGGRPGVSPPQTRSFQETGAAPGGDGRVDGVKSLFKGVCSPGGGRSGGSSEPPLQRAPMGRVSGAHRTEPWPAAESQSHLAQ